MKRVIESFTDTDLYKFTMHQVVFLKYPGAHGKYRFKCRNKADLLQYMDEIKAEIGHLSTLEFTPKELDDLRRLPYFRKSYIDFLEDFQVKSRYIHVEERNGEIDIWFEGPILQTMLLEIYTLRIVNEVYFRNQVPVPNYEEGTERLHRKIDTINKYVKESGNSFNLVDFGTRRAFSGDWHRMVVKTLAKKLPREVFSSTSNVKLAFECGLTPMGSMAHEFVQMFQGLGTCDPVDSQKEALQVWADVYRGSLGIALSDTLGMDMFLHDFDGYFARLYDGVRHDSGDPFEFIGKVIDHYKGLGIDPLTKTIVFSDGLDVDKAIKLAECCRDRIKVVFGIGTNLTNDLGYEALQIVLKLIMCGNSEFTMSPVAKISNDSGKGMCEDEDYLKSFTQSLSLYSKYPVKSIPVLEPEAQESGTFIIFEDNDIMNMHDHFFYRGIPSGIEFKLEETKDLYTLKAPGYGGNPYGSGTILVKKPALDENKEYYKTFVRGEEDA